MEFTLLLLAAFLILSLTVVVKLMTKPSAPRLPPGPWQLPVVGSPHHLLLSPFRDTAHLAITELSRNYGPLMLLRLGAVPTLIVSSAEAAREVMKTHDTLFCDRYPKATANIVSRGGQGIVLSRYNDRWRESRKICVLELFSQRRVLSFRPVREEEAARLVHSISNECGGGFVPINLSEKINRMVSDTVVSTTIGGQCKRQDELLHYINKSLELSVGFNLADLYPSSRLMSLFSAATRDLVRYHRIISDIIENIIHERGVMPSLKRDEDDLVSVLLRVQRNGGLKFPITMDHVSTTIFDIFVAGSETSSTTLDWTMSELMKNPRVLRKAQSEVRSAFAGKEKLDEEDIAKLSYLPLVLKETLRLHAPVPFLIPRECREACQVMGYDISKGCMVMVNVWAIGRDGRYWDDPCEFKPERFENNNSVDFKGANFEYIPFGAGRRMCPGIMLGLANIELALASLLYHFDWKLSGVESEDLDMREASGLTVKRKVDLMVHAKPYRPSK